MFAVYSIFLAAEMWDGDRWLVAHVVLVIVSNNNLLNGSVYDFSLDFISKLAECVWSWLSVRSLGLGGDRLSLGSVAADEFWLKLVVIFTSRLDFVVVDLVEISYFWVVIAIF